jgi:hypothetical protein
MGGHFEDFHPGEPVDLSLFLFCSLLGDGSVQAAELKVWVLKSLARSFCGCLFKLWTWGDLVLVLSSRLAWPSVPVLEVLDLMPILAVQRDAPVFISTWLCLIFGPMPFFFLL